MIINIVIIVAIVYGMLVIIGGIIGYIKVGSKIFLIFGSISGLLLIISGII